jgi:hypothetical protein
LWAKKEKKRKRKRKRKGGGERKVEPSEKSQPYRDSR